MKKTSIFSLLLMVSSVFTMDVEKTLVHTGIINFLDQNSAARNILTKAILQKTLNQELLEACTGNNSVEAMKKLIEQGADPLCHDDFGMTSLMSQAGNDNPEAVNYLLQVVQDREKVKANFFRRDINGNTALMLSVICGCEQSLRVLQKYHHEVFGKKLDDRHWDNHGNTSLMLAASMPWENIAILELLLQNKVDDINEKNSDGDTALHCAVKRGNFRIVQHLIGHGAKVDIQNKKKHTVLEEAIIHNHDEIFKFFMKDLPNGGRSIDDLLRIALCWKNFNACYYLVEEKGANPLDKDFCKKTVLMRAAQSGSVDLVRYLVEKGASVLNRDNDGKTVLMYAAGSGNLELVRYLVEEKGANPLDKDSVGDTALMYAAESGNVDLIRYLEKGLDIGYYVGILLVNAIQSGNVDLVRYLVEEKGANPLGLLSQGCTVLMHAAHSGNLEIVRYLVEEKRANLLDKDDRNKTVLSYAKESRNIDLVRYLEGKIQPKV